MTRNHHLLLLKMQGCTHEMLVVASLPTQIIQWCKIRWDPGPCHIRMLLLPTSSHRYGLRLCKVPMAEMGCYTHHIHSPCQPFHLQWLRHAQLPSHRSCSLSRIPCINPMAHCLHLALHHHQIPLGLQCQSQTLFSDLSILRNMRSVTIPSFSLRCSSLDSLVFLRTVPSERHQPKHSFLSTRCAWFLYPVSACLLQTSFLLHALPQHSLIPLIAQPTLPFIPIRALVLRTPLGPCIVYLPI